MIEIKTLLNQLIYFCIFNVIEMQKVIIKKVIIIGATSGIGRGLAELHANNDCMVGLIGRREHLLKNFIHKRKIDTFTESKMFQVPL